MQWGKANVSFLLMLISTLHIPGPHVFKRKTSFHTQFVCVQPIFHHETIIVPHTKMVNESCLVRQGDVDWVTWLCDKKKLNESCLCAIRWSWMIHVYVPYGEVEWVKSLRDKEMHLVARVFHSPFSHVFNSPSVLSWCHKMHLCMYTLLYICIFNISRDIEWVTTLLESQRHDSFNFCVFVQYLLAASRYGVATWSRLLKIIGLFCRILSLL